MLNDNLYFLAADTLRTKVYIFYLIKNNIIPKKIFFLKSNKLFLPGSFKKKILIKNKHLIDFSNNKYSLNGIEKFINSKDFYYKLNQTFNIQYSNTKEINSKNIFSQIKKIKNGTIIFSGFGGSIVGDKLLNTNNLFLHCHGGYLPNFKGSTTNYYSAIKDNSVGASTIFLNEKIDRGPILFRMKFRKPKYMQELDTIADSAARSIVLIKTLKQIIKKNKIKLQSNKSKEDNYFIIHPILKHLAINS